MDSPAAPQATEKQPKIAQRMLLRFAIGLIIVAALIFGYQKWSDYSKDPDLPRANDTAGFLAARELLEEGSQVVVVKESGAIERSPGYAAGKTDREPLWMPDGNRLFFVSDREADTYNLYRWNFASNKVMRRSIGTRAQGAPSFPAPDAPNANEAMLITSGGVVLALYPTTLRTEQVLPPVIKDRGESEESSAGQFERVYRQLGTSFRLARWSKDKRFVAAIMRREDESEILIIQDVVKYDPPQLVAAGQKIEVELNHANGAFVFVVVGFRFPDPNQIPPEAIKNGKLVMPFSSLIGQIEPGANTGMAPILPAGDPKIGFQHLRISPDGANLCVLAGEVDSNANFDPRELLIVPARPEGGREVKRMIAGKIYEPVWHPNSKALAFAMYDEKKKRSLYTVNLDGSSLTNVTKSSGDFADPVFSPQSK